MKKLTEQDVIRIMSEEYDKRVAKLSDEILSSELKVKHKSGILYTINSVGPRDVMLRTPEGDQILVDKDTLENEYVLA